ncbi:hypothetical protein [Rickettsia akari]|uniref:hypothetical protein n=1 Tax=Rickettsia akari TaxID=786 RepID=UPI00004620CB|nr:hypothetical protein [Rickettsia akari]
MPGAGNIVVDNTVFTKLLSMNSIGQVIFNQALDLGAGGNILFGVDVKLITNGVTGSITTSTNNQGTLIIQSGNVNGMIGANSSLKLVNIEANPVTFSDNVFAPVALNNNGSILTLSDGVTLTGVVTTTPGDDSGKLIFADGGTVTGSVGANRAALEEIIFNGINIQDVADAIADVTTAWISR